MYQQSSTPGAGIGVSPLGQPSNQSRTRGGQTTRPPGYGLGAFAGDPLGYLKDTGRKVVSPFEEMVKGISDGYSAAKGGAFKPPTPGPSVDPDTGEGIVSAKDMPMDPSTGEGIMSAAAKGAGRW